MRLFRKILCLFLVLAVLWIPVEAEAASQDFQDYVQRMLQYYLRFQEEADEEIRVLLEYLQTLDPVRGAVWRQIMTDWSYTNSGMVLNEGMLPDGLPGDDSLCIIIMGYGLRADGTMKEELVDRLVVGLSSALKYPNAYVVVTGGATSRAKGVTEAGQMARWLMDRGVEPHRIIQENRSYSTLQNVQRVYSILIRDYPQITTAAVVTSDYHIRQSCVLFSAIFSQGTHVSGNRQIRVISNAANTTGKQEIDLYTQAWGISAITGVPFDSQPESQPELCE